MCSSVHSTMKRQKNLFCSLSGWLTMMIVGDVFGVGEKTSSTSSFSFIHSKAMRICEISSKDQRPTHSLKEDGEDKLIFFQPRKSIFKGESLRALDPWDGKREKWSTTIFGMAFRLRTAQNRMKQLESIDDEKCSRISLAAQFVRWDLIETTLSSGWWSKNLVYAMPYHQMECFRSCSSSGMFSGEAKRRCWPIKTQKSGRCFTHTFALTSSRGRELLLRVFYDRSLQPKKRSSAQKGLAKTQRNAK